MNLQTLLIDINLKNNTTVINILMENTDLVDSFSQDKVSTMVAFPYLH